MPKGGEFGGPGLVGGKGKEGVMGRLGQARFTVVISSSYVCADPRPIVRSLCETCDVRQRTAGFQTAEWGIDIVVYSGDYGSGIIIVRWERHGVLGKHQDKTRASWYIVH